MRLITACLLLLALAIWREVDALESVALHDEGNWTVYGRSGGGGPWSARPPTTVLQLITGELGADPLYRFGETNFSAIPFEEFVWNCSFSLPEGLLGRHGHLQLQLEGLDTAAEVELNGAPLGRPANAHRPHVYDATGLLREQGNVLTVTLDSPVNYATQRAAAYPYPVPATQQLGALPHYNFIRKPASDFGWDWGPAYAPGGVTGGVWLRRYSQPFLTGLNVRQEHHPNGSITLTVDAFLQPTSAEAQGVLSAAVSDAAGKQLWAAQRSVTVPACPPQQASEQCLCSGGGVSGGSFDGDGVVEEAGPGSGGGAAAVAGGSPLGSCAAAGQLGAVRRSVAVLVEPPYDLWWPHEFGAQALYTLRLTFAPGNASRGGGEEEGESSMERRVGFRTVELVRDPIALEGGAPGETFYFRVNGLPLYAKGANVIPADILETRVTPEALRQLVSDAKAAHMNMLRVWGGGRYFQDAFYDACDEAGMLVWQEAMFACAMYPRDAAFLREVSAEVAYQAGRLSPHPSVALWGGNNENEASFNWFPETRAAPQRWAVDYSVLFVGAVRQALLAQDPGVLYLDTSPSNGLLSSDPYVKRWGDVIDPAYGDVHFYDYLRDALDPDTYPPAKFVSEFGFMSFPSFSEYQKVTEPQDWAIDSEMTNFRMRHANGVQELLTQLRRHFLPAPAPAPSPLAAAISSLLRPPTAGAPNASAGAVTAGPRPQPTARLAPVARPLSFLDKVKQQILLMVLGPDALEGSVGPTGEPGSSGGAAEAPGAAGATAPEVPALQAPAPAAEAVGIGGPAAEVIAPATEGGGGKAANATAAEQFKAFVYLTQVQQALVYETAISRWRRFKSDPAAVTWGVLYWQLNDIWQGPSWSSLNYGGAWKPLHHAARSFLQPVAVSGVLQGAGRDLVSVHLTNDLSVGVEGTLTVDAIPYSATHPNNITQLAAQSNVSVAAFRSGPVWNASLAETVLPAVQAAGGAALAARNFFFRLRFCPTRIDTSQGYPSPLGHTGPQPPSDGSGGGLGDLSDGSAGGCGGPAGTAGAAAGAPSADQCAAARRLLQCSESFLYPSEFKDAALAQGKVAVAGVEWADAEGLAPAQAAALEALSGGASANTSVIAIRLELSAPFLPLFVVLESPMPGRFLENSLHLLPWESHTLHFVPGGGQQCAGDGGLGQCSRKEMEAVLREFQDGLTVQWLQRAMATGAGLGQAGAGGTVSKAQLAG